MTFRTARRLLAALSLGLLGACASVGGTPALETHARVDLPRYMGRWWVIAHIPYFAERGKVATADEYALRADGRIDNVYVYRKAFDAPEKRMSGVATVVPGSNNARWQIRFFGGLVRADYVVLEVAPDYSWALIGHPGRKLAWVFARSPIMAETQYRQLVARFADYGYDPTKLQRVPQQPAP